MKAKATIVLAALFCVFSYTANADKRRGACTRYERNHPKARWQLKGCNDRTAYRFCLIDNETHLFGNRSRASFKGVLFYRNATCQSNIPKSLSPDDNLR